MAAGLRVLQTRDPQGLTFSDVTDSLKDFREQKQKEAEKRATQRLKDIEAVNNDLKTPYFRNQISKLIKEYQDYVQSPEYDPIKASQMKEVIINAKRNLGELDAYVAQSCASHTDDAHSLIAILSCQASQTLPAVCVAFCIVLHTLSIHLYHSQTQS